MVISAEQRLHYLWRKSNRDDSSVRRMNISISRFIGGDIVSSSCCREVERVGEMLTIEELLERHTSVVPAVEGLCGSWTYLDPPRIEVWDEFRIAQQQGLRKVPTLLNKLSKVRSEMAPDELELLDSLIAEQHEKEAEGNLSWTRISLHMDTLDLLEKASKKKGMSKSEVAEIAMREYFKSNGIE